MPASSEVPGPPCTTSKLAIVKGFGTIPGVGIRRLPAGLAPHYAALTVKKKPPRAQSPFPAATLGASVLPGWRLSLRPASKAPAGPQSLASALTGRAQATHNSSIAPEDPLAAGGITRKPPKKGSTKETA